jgi:hypothetical protein
MPVASSSGRQQHVGSSAKGKQFAYKRLDAILKESSRAITAPEKHLNEIYLTVLKHSISLGYTDEEKEELCGMLKHTLGSIVVLLSPLSTFSLSKLLRLPREVVNQILGDLHVILDILEDQARPLRLHHPSSADINRDTFADRLISTANDTFHCTLSGRNLSLRRL